MTQEALKLALEKIATVNAMDYEYQAWAREALAQTQEPVAYYHPHKGFYFAKPTSVSAPTIVDVEPLALYTTPPQRTWVGLTNNELQPIADEYRILFGSWVEDFARAIEAKLKEKNT